MAEKRKGTLIFYRDAGERWRWRFVASNGNILADSGQSYSRRIDCERGAHGTLYAIPFDTEVVA